MRQDFEHSLLRGDFKQAIEELDSLKQRAGVSYWWIKTRIASLQLGEGLDAQKKFASEVRRGAWQKGVTSYITYQVSVRNEPSITPARYEAQAKQQIESLSTLPEDWKTFVLHHVLGSRSITASEAADVLRHSEAASVIDTYEALLFSARCGAIQWGDKYRSSFQRALSTLADAIPDARLRPLQFFVTGSGVLQPADDSGFLEQLGGNEEASKSEAIRSMQQRPLSSEATTVLARLKESVIVQSTSIANSSETANGPQQRDDEAATEAKQSTATLAARIGAWQRDVVQSVGTVEGSRTELARLALNFAGFAWAERPNALALRAQSPLIPDAESHLPPSLSDEAKSIDLACLFATTAVPYAHPLMLEPLSPSSRARVVAGFGSSRSTNPFVKDLLSADSVLEGSYSLEESMRLTCLANIRLGALGEANKIALELQETGHPYYKIEGIRCAALTHLLLRDPESTVAYVASVFVRDEQLRNILPIRETADLLDRTTMRHLGGEISTSVVLDAYSRFVNAAYESLRRRAYEQLMSKHGVRQPTELRSVADRFDHLQLCYFLAHICVPEVIYLSGGFSGPRALEIERISILNWLSDIDPARREIYQQEIIDRTRDLVIQDRRLEIERSKIQIDPEGFHRQAERTQRTTFERYIAFRRSAVQVTDFDDFSAALEDLKKGDPQAMLALAVPQDEAAALFASMIYELRDDFVFNGAYGLDGVLSTRIRHGTLENELRAPLSMHHLVTERDEATQEYKSNRYWLEQLRAPTTSEIASGLDAAFRRFSADTDALIEEMCGEWIQIRRDDTSRGMIDLSFSADSLTLIERLLPEDATFEEFLGSVLGILIRRLVPSLETVRTRIENEAKERITKSLATLRAHVESFVALDPRDLLNAIETARTSTHQAIDRIGSWFDLMDQAGKEPLPLADAIEICVQVAERMLPGFVASIELGGAAAVRVDGLRLPFLVDAFLILFENAKRYGRDPDSPRVEITCREEGPGVRFDVVNNIRADMDVERARSRLANILGGMKDESYIQSQRVEHGTGLHKLFKIVRHDFGGSPGLTAAYIANGRFSVSFSIPLEAAS